MMYPRSFHSAAVRKMPGWPCSLAGTAVAEWTGPTLKASTNCAWASLDKAMLMYWWARSDLLVPAMTAMVSIPTMGGKSRVWTTLTFMPWSRR